VMNKNAMFTMMGLALSLVLPAEHSSDVSVTHPIGTTFGMTTRRTTCNGSPVLF